MGGNVPALCVPLRLCRQLSPHTCILVCVLCVGAYKIHMCRACVRGVHDRHQRPTDHHTRYVVHVHSFVPPTQRELDTIEKAIQKLTKRNVYVFEDC